MAQTLDDFQGEIFWLYIVLKKKATEVIAFLKCTYGFNASPKQLKTKLGQWGFSKYVKRGDVIRILQENSRWQGEGASINRLPASNRRPVDLEKVERHRKRAFLPDYQQQSRLGSIRDRTGDITCETHPVYHPAPPLERLSIPEKFFHNIDRLIKDSFEAGIWRSKGNDLLIKSSNRQDREIKALHDFLGQFAIGCHAAESRNPETRNLDWAGDCWREAFLNIETLVRGHYHDIIPNLIQKINDLNRQRHNVLAAFLKSHIAGCAHMWLAPGTLAFSIFDGFGKIDMNSMPEIEERVMEQFTKLFELYLGHRCYSSFVMTMDAARRRLLQNPSASFDCLPEISRLDSVFGPADRRSLDVIGVRVEILNHRRMLTETEAEASLLVQRASMIQDDDWQRFYNLTRGWYFLGSAQYFLRKREAAIQNLSNALRSDEILCQIDNFHIFDTERMIVLKYLEHLRSSDWILGEAREADGSWTPPLDPLVFFRCCKEPISVN